MSNGKDEKVESDRPEKKKKEVKSQPVLPQQIPFALDLANTDEARTEIKFLEHVPFVFTPQRPLKENELSKLWEPFPCYHCDIVSTQQAVYRPIDYDQKRDDFVYSPLKFMSIACIRRYIGDTDPKVLGMRKSKANTLLTIMTVKKYRIYKPIVAAPPKAARKVHGGKYTDEEFVQLIADATRVEITQHGMVTEKMFMTVQKLEEYEKKPVSDEKPAPRVYSTSTCEPMPLSLSGTSRPLSKYLDKDRML